MSFMDFFRCNQRPNPRQGFYEHCDTLKRGEKDKKYFCEAANINYQNAPPVVTANNILKVAAILGGTVILSALIICAYFSGHPGLQFVAAVVSLLSFLFVGMGLSD